MILSEKTVRGQFSPTKWNRGGEYYRKKKAQITEVKVVYFENEEEPAYEVHGRVQGSGSKTYSVSFTACNEEIHNIACTCPDFRSYYYGYWENKNGCKHLAAATLEFIEYSNLNPIEVKTSKTVSALISEYSEESIAKVVTNFLEEKIDIEPRLDVEMGTIRVSFRIGGKKKYVIKNLQEFYTNMKIGTKVAYGKDLELIHHMNCFTKEGQKYAKFIISRIEENQLLMAGIYGGSGKAPDKRYISLSPHSLDNLFSIIVGQEVNYSGNTLRGDKNVVNKITCVHENPILQLVSRQFKSENKKNVSSEFAGINLELENIEYFPGEIYSYIRRGNILYQTDENYKKVMDSFLIHMNKLRDSEVKVGKESLGAFYRHVLGKIKDYVELIEEENSQLEQYIPPEPEFYFYLDCLNKSNINCKTKIKYGEKEYVAYRQEQEDEYIRDFAKEFEILLTVQKYLPFYDNKLEVYHCDCEEDLIYQFLDAGIDDLMSLGEVKVTDEFKRLQIKPSPKVSVGVSIESDLMNLELSATNLDFAELADVLESYRFRKKYHRLKNGEFLRLEDNALATLTELVDGLHLSVKELTKGKMHIPAYRALYLDKVLQESEDVAYERDSQYKSLLRNFKGVEDSDYEVP